ncbi:WecB/TagA/CpsF family glycosyltransferase [Solirubrobacter sp. CPCC 204708]|uniref:WecB/TagA/CpsF family glycosyltransferase n=2 Tax=Solirubrobacter deserti TaxID=2282478 RepID=A0ABT4RM46_9ACTN|nr:WecB/TagA/CpsF family glycosyltransferase [Solirubrobacter deserti]MDA0139643.1 WecB/TagA/CpsF family glycosyltransferase [Solirubrobacter deserti]
MGLEVQRVDEAEVIVRTLEAVATGRGGWICPVNLDVLRQTVRDPAQRDLVEQADMVVADGMPLIWASRLQRTPLPERVSGSSLIRSLPAAGREAGASIFLLGGEPGVADAAADELRRTLPGVDVCGTLCPPFGFERFPEELAAIEASLERTRPDIVFVGLGFPKQDRLILRLRSRFPSIWFISCGISLSYLSGDVSRAPVWLQRAGLEWLHRLAQEPRRLARRYLVDGFPFLARLMISALRQRVSPA